MATTWTTETKEKVNYTKLCRLLFDGGTLAVRTVFDGLCLPTPLGATLKANQCKLQKFKKPAGKVLNQDQWDKLYPSSGASPRSQDFDITLLVFLLRNICGLTPPATGWDALPPSTDTSLEANIVRIKYYRNNVIAHNAEAEVDDTLFKVYWSDISGPLVSLGLQQDDIDELKSSSLGSKDYKQLMEYWYKSDKEIKHKMDAIKTDTSEIKSETAEIKSELSDIKSKMACTQVEREISKLAHIDCTSLIQKSCRFYHQSTRQWIFNQVEETVQKESSGASVVLIRAGPGMGKSVVAAKICEIYKKSGYLGGCHFFQHSNSLRNNPRMMLQSIARQLCNSLTGYQAALETKLKTLQGKDISDFNCEELFGLLFEEPLSQICIDHNVVIVIDALDECASQFKKEIEDVLNRKLSDLPSWIQFVITTRHLPSCCNVSHVVKIEIDPSDSRNVEDLRKFFNLHLAQHNDQQLIDKLMKISNGLFLVAHFVLKILEDNGYEPIPEVLECFPHGISSVYTYYFTRIQKIIKPYIRTSESEDESFFQMLEAVVAAKSPIPKAMFYEILCLKSVEEVQRAKRMERNDAVLMLHTIFPVENDHVNVFHKSVTDWLNRDGENTHEFSVSASNGGELLAQKSLGVLKAFKKAVKEVERPLIEPLVLSDSELFALGIGMDCIFASSKLVSSEKEEIFGSLSIITLILLSGHFAFKKLSLVKFNFDFPLFAKMYVLYYYNSPLWANKYRSFSGPGIQQKEFFFGHCLNIVGSFLCLNDKQVQELSDLQIKYKLPRHLPDPCVVCLPNAFQHQRPSSFLGLYQITNGFIAVNVDPEAEPPTSTVLNIKDDGSYDEPKSFVSSLARGVSPDKKFLIITKTNSSKLELFDVTTLEKVREYHCPINRVDSCYIFGDEQWYIVVKAQGDPKIYILDGLNGQLHKETEVGETDEIETVSQCGHILISNTWKEDEPYEDVDTLTDVLFWVNAVAQNVTCRKIYTIHFTKADEKVYYCIPKKYLSGLGSFVMQGNPFKFSNDGKYFALYYKSGVFVFHTNDGTILDRVSVPFWDFREIVFLSSSCLVVGVLSTHNSVLMFFELINNAFIYVAPVNSTELSRLLVPPQHHTEDKFIRTLFELNNNELVKYEFLNLEQNL